MVVFVIYVDRSRHGLESGRDIGAERYGSALAANRDWTRCVTQSSGSLREGIGGIGGSPAMRSLPASNPAEVQSAPSRRRAHTNAWVLGLTPPSRGNGWLHQEANRTLCLVAVEWEMGISRGVPESCTGRTPTNLRMREDNPRLARRDDWTSVFTPGHSRCVVGPGSLLKN